MTDPRIESHNATVHQTDHFTQEQIEYLKETATRQARIIGRLYFASYPTPLTPSKAKIGCKQIGAAKGEAKTHTWPLTSVRARITELTDAGILEKTDKTAEGEFGRPEHKWKWKAPKRADRQETTCGTYRLNRDYGNPPRTQREMFEPEVKSRAYEL